MWRVRIDPASGTVVVTPDRSTQMHLNVTKLLETKCEDCLKISNLKVTGPQELSLDVTLKHPYSADSLALTAFDVRGIFVTDGDTQPTFWDSIAIGDSVPRLLNPDGYTGLYNPTNYPESLPDPPALKYFHGKFATVGDLSATINPFLAFSQDKPRRMFLPGTQETKKMVLHVPGWPFEFGYAIDANWAPPTKEPVTDPETDFPPSANCIEPYMISVTVGDGLDEWSGSSTQIGVDIFDHQGLDSDWYLYDLYPWDGPHFDALSGGSTITPEGNLHAWIYVQNTFSVAAGQYPVFIYYIGDGNPDPNFQYVPAWQVATVIVHPMGEYAPIVKADAYPKLQVAGVPIEFWDSGTIDPDGDALVKWEWDWDGDGVYDAEGKDLFHTFDSPGDYSVTLRVTDSDGQVGVLETPLAIHVKTSQGWARTWGTESACATATDQSGNVYVTGVALTGDYDPGPKEDWHYCTLGNRGAFLSKFDADGDFLWARTWCSTYEDPYQMLWADVFGTGVLVDENQDVYVTGTYASTVDFDPGPGEDLHSTTGGSDCYLIKFGPGGDYQWVKTWGGSSLSNLSWVSSMCAGPNGEIALGGYFEGATDFDPGPGEDIHVSNGVPDCFVAEFDTSGNFLWAATWGGPFDPGGPIYDSDDYVHGVAVDNLGNVYAVGNLDRWGLPVDLDPGPGVDLTDNPDFMIKFDSSGNYQWGRTWTETGWPNYDQYCGCSVRSISVGENDNLYIAGQFETPYIKTFDFDPGPGVEEHKSTWHNAPDVFLSKFDPSGSFIWVRTWGPGGADMNHMDRHVACSANTQGSVHVFGRYLGVVDFDPGPGETIHNCGYDDWEGHMFLSKFNSEGDFQWVNVWGYAGTADIERPGAVTTAPGDYAYACGGFEKTTDFDPGPGEDWHTSIYSSNAFLSKFPPDGVW